MSARQEPTSYEQRATVARLINRAQSDLVGALDLALRPSDVSAAQYVILSTLWYERARTAAQICKEISYSPGAMTRMLDRLEQKQLVRRVRLEYDRRAVELELSPAGKEVFPKLLAVSEKVIERYFGKFNKQELEQFEALLNRMLTTP